MSGKTNSKANRFLKFFDAEKGIYAIPIAMFILLSIISPNFLTVQNVVNLLLQVTVVGIAAIGQTMVIITAGIDLSVSSLISLTGCFSIGSYLQFGLVGSIILTLIVGIAVGALNGVIIAKGRIEAFITTLAMTSIVQSIVLLYTKGYPKFIKEAAKEVDPSFGSDFLFLGGGKLFKLIPFPFLILLGATIIIHIVLSKTRLGRYIYAIGGNKETARLSGINVTKIQIITYSLCGLTAALAGIVYASRIGTGLPNMGTGYELQSVAAVVIGGTTLSGGRGSVMKTLAGTFVFGILGNGLNLLGITPSLQYMAIGVIILMAVLINEMNRRKLMGE